MAVVDRTTQRADPSHVHTLASFSVATIHEAQDRTDPSASRLRPIYPRARVAGTALTCEVAPGDNSSIHVAGDDVVVVAREDDLDVIAECRVRDAKWAVHRKLLAAGEGTSTSSDYVRSSSTRACATSTNRYRRGGTTWR